MNGKQVSQGRVTQTSTESRSLLGARTEPQPDDRIWPEFLYTHLDDFCGLRRALTIDGDAAPARGTPRRRRRCASRRRQESYYCAYRPRSRSPTVIDLMLRSVQR